MKKKGLQACLTNNTGYRYGCISEIIDPEKAQKAYEIKKRRYHSKHDAQEIDEKVKDQEELVNLADERLYKAKEGGRNQFIYN